MDDNVRSAAGRLLVLAAQVEDLLGDLKNQTRECQVALRTTHEKEIVQFGQNMAAALDEQQRRIDDAMRPKIVRAWQFIAVATLLILVLVGATMGLSAHYAGVIRENRQSAKMLKAINRADVTICGESLCAKIDKKAARWGEKGEYVPIHSR